MCRKFSQINNNSFLKHLSPSHSGVSLRGNVEGDSMIQKVKLHKCTHTLHHCSVMLVSFNSCCHSQLRNVSRLITYWTCSLRPLWMPEKQLWFTNIDHFLHVRDVHAWHAAPFNNPTPCLTFCPLQQSYPMPDILTPSTILPHAWHSDPFNNSTPCLTFWPLQQSYPMPDILTPSTILPHAWHAAPFNNSTP